jgi:hypothetical protein
MSEKVVNDFVVKRIEVPDMDCDVILVFPSGNEIEIQSRPSNGDGGDYNGSLDIILPHNLHITCWEGDDMTPSKAIRPDHPETRLAKQLYTEIP